MQYEQIRMERNRRSPVEGDDEPEDEDDEDAFFEARPRPAQPRNLNQYLDLLSQPNETDMSQQNIGSLPVEGEFSVIYLLNLILYQGEYRLSLDTFLSKVN